MNNLLMLVRDSSHLREIAGLIKNVIALRDVFRKSIEVESLKTAIISGSISELELRECIGELLGSFRKGEAFEGDIFLAALAVAVEEFKNSFAEDYLQSLAQLRLAELPISIRIAQHINLARKQLPMNHNTPLIQAVTGVPAELLGSEDENIRRHPDLSMNFWNRYLHAAA